MRSHRGGGARTQVTLGHDRAQNGHRMDGAEMRTPIARFGLPPGTEDPFSLGLGMAIRVVLGTILTPILGSIGGSTRAAISDDGGNG